MTTTLQAFAKSRGLRVHQAKAVVKQVLGELPEQLTDEDIERIDGFQPDTHQKQLSSNIVHEQPSNIVHENKQPISQHTQNSVFDASTELCVSRVHQILSADLTLQQQHIKQLLNDDYVETVGKINLHNQRKEDLLMSNLRQSYNTVKNHQPKVAHQYTSEFDAMVDELSELGIDIKS